MTKPNDEPDYGAECVKAVDEWVCGWMKHPGDPSIKPGDMIVWGASPSDYGRVEVVTRRTIWRWRLQAWRRALMWWKP